MWQERSHIQWLKNGDHNTKFFHGTATQRKRRNFLMGLRDENGGVVGGCGGVFGGPE